MGSFVGDSFFNFSHEWIDNKEQKNRWSDGSIDLEHVDILTNTLQNVYTPWNMFDNSTAYLFS